MRRYIDFRADDWTLRTDSRMQAARWTACMDGLGEEPPLAGVIDTYSVDLLQELLEEGWVDMQDVPQDETLRLALRESVMRTLADDADCLSSEEHTLVERMLIGEGSVVLETVAEMEAAYTLRMRLWCDLGVVDDDAMAKLDDGIAEALPQILMRSEHRERRARIFIYEGMLHGMLYISGYLDDRMPMKQFIEEVLQTEENDASRRLACNFIEASFDTYLMAGCKLLVHEALADPESLSGLLAEQGAFHTPTITPGLVAASMNGLLPEEIVPDEQLQRALHGALRPEYEPNDAASDLRYLAKQDAPMDTLQEIMASMLVVLPTEHMDGALKELTRKTGRWISRAVPPPKGADGTLGYLH